MSHTTAPMSMNNPRLRALVLPREHGAWGILLVPLATGAAIGAIERGSGAVLPWFVMAALSLFWLRTPVESLLGTSPMKAQTSAERRSVMLAIAACTAVAFISLVVIFWGMRNSGLLLLGVAAAAAFAVQTGVKSLGRKTRMVAQVIGAIGLTITAPAAYYVVTGRLDATAMVLWLLNWMFAGNQIHFVQNRIRYSRVHGWRERLSATSSFFAGQLAMIAAIAAVTALRYTSALVFVAFIPALVRGTMWYFEGEKKLDVHRLGLTELTHAITFGLLLITAYRLR